MRARQAGLLAQKDSWTPCFGVLIQLVLNCVGDVLLIGHMQLGLAGAAWATVVSQWAGTLVTLWALPRSGRVGPLCFFRRHQYRENSPVHSAWARGPVAG